MTRAAILCPGRGSYTDASLGSLSAVAGQEWVARAEELRRGYELPPLLELDRAKRFSPVKHLAPANAAPLIYLVTMLDAAAAAAENEIVAVAGNSMGWYSALAVAGALSFDDGFRLVQEMAILQQEEQARGGGGQVIYPRVDEQWRADPGRIEAVRAALDAARGEAFRSIELGGHAVLAGTDRGLELLARLLPAVKQGRTSYPLKLAQHGPYHTPLAASVAARARDQLARLEFRAPSATLVDGRGARFTPWSADPDALRAYTLGAQIVEPYDFTASVRVVLREYAPARLVLPGPGNTLGGVCGQILAAEGWRGIRSKAEFEAVQAGADPIVVSMRR